MTKGWKLGGESKPLTTDHPSQLPPIMPSVVQRAVLDPPHAMPVGTDIIVREGLKGAHGKRAGRSGIVLGHDSTESTDARRVKYEVQVYGLGEGMPVTFTHDMILQKAKVVLMGLQARPELNGKYGCVMGWVSEKGRFNVMIEGGEWVQVRPNNLQMRSGTRVTIASYGEAPKYNGRIGKVAGWDALMGQYEVEVYDDEALTVRKILRIKPESVVL